MVTGMATEKATNNQPFEADCRIAVSCGRKFRRYTDDTTACQIKTGVKRHSPKERIDDCVGVGASLDSSRLSLFLLEEVR